MLSFIVPRKQRKHYFSKLAQSKDLQQTETTESFIFSLNSPLQGLRQSNPQNLQRAWNLPTTWTQLNESSGQISKIFLQSPWAEDEHAPCQTATRSGQEPACEHNNWGVSQWTSSLGQSSRNLMSTCKGEEKKNPLVPFFMGWGKPVTKKNPHQAHPSP